MSHVLYEKKLHTRNPNQALVLFEQHVQNLFLKYKYPLKYENFLIYFDFKKSKMCMANLKIF